ncbi:MAG: glycosyltransferase family 4 protein [Candidatus Helarchaeota archaeon]
MVDPKFSILIIGITWPPETFLLHLIDGIADKGIKIWVASNETPPEEWKRKGNRDYIWAPSWRISYFSRCVNLLLLLKNLIGLRKDKLKAIFRLLKNKSALKLKIYTIYKILPFVKLEINIVYFPWVFLSQYLIDWFKLSNQSVVVSLRGSMVNVYPYSNDNNHIVASILSSILNRVNTVHCVSNAIQKEAIKFGLAIEKSKIIQPAVDPIFFAPPGKSPNNNCIKLVTTGSLFWRKGYEYLLLAIKKLVGMRINAELHIIGEGEDYNRILYTSHDLDLEKMVILHGKLSPENVRNYLQSSDIFIFSSLSEGIANAVLEAMSCGLPVVTTDCGGMREAIDDGVEGFVVQVRDPWAMALAIKKLAEDPSLRKKMGTAGRQRVLKDFVLDDQVEKFINLFKSLQETDKHSV